MPNEVTFLFKLQVPPDQLIHDGVNPPVASRELTITLTPQLEAVIKRRGTINLRHNYGPNFFGTIMPEQTGPVIVVVGMLLEANLEHLNTLREHDWTIHEDVVKGYECFKPQPATA